MLLMTNYFVMLVKLLNPPCARLESVLKQIPTTTTVFLRLEVRIVRRETGAKMDVKRGDMIEQVKELLEKIQRNLYDVANEKVEECTQKVETWDEFVGALSQNKLILAPWCDHVEVEKDVKKRTRSEETGAGGAKTLCILPLSSLN
ncbi:hypothetical protein CARUB_v10028068mg [Capsella rubella]|uniref:Proline-tRNA ligase class II C-terminal domain-containing protein n=1 Tax=Capsella rubella TaxID=81985 RepID=R0GNF1_9BRAS|nr:hypothetical protein CARUB_v10028068mg [Capsella rubella]